MFSIEQIIYIQGYLKGLLTFNTIRGEHFEIVSKIIQEITDDFVPGDIDEQNDHEEEEDMNCPEAYGYRSWSEMSFGEAFDNDISSWEHYNQ